MKEILDQVATDLGKYIFEILKSIPDLPENRPANAPDESQYEEKEGYKDPIEDFIMSNGLDCLKEEMRESGCNSIEEFLEQQRSLMDMYSIGEPSPDVPINPKSLTRNELE